MRTVLATGILPDVTLDRGPRFGAQLELEVRIDSLDDAEIVGDEVVEANIDEASRIRTIARLEATVERSREVLALRRRGR